MDMITLLYTYFTAQMVAITPDNTKEISRTIVAEAITTASTFSVEWMATDKRIWIIMYILES